MLMYPVQLDKDEEAASFAVSFPDIPEAHTFGNTVDDSLMHAADALESALDFYFDDKRPVPLPSTPAPGQHVVELPISLSAKILLLNEMLAQQVRPAELARRLHTTPQEVNRLTNLHHATKIDGIADAMKALGKRLVVSAV